jgi:hypothetical protein
MKKTIFAATLILTGIVTSSTVRSQIASGNGFAIEKSVVANGGGASSGNGYSIEGTAGQAIARQGSSNGFILDHGFWQSGFAPTAASVSISGRVLTADGRGLRNAVISLTERSGVSRKTLSSTFGYFRFDEIEAGQIVILNVNSKIFQFAPQVVSVSDNMVISDLSPVR